MAGGVLKGFGVLFMVLGGLGILVGLVAAAFGGAQVEGENDRGFFADRDRAEEGAILGIAGLSLAALGLGVLLIGILLFALGSHLARRELIEAVRARQPAAPAPPAGPAAPAAPPAAEAPRPPADVAGPARAPAQAPPLPPPREIAAAGPTPPAPAALPHAPPAAPRAPAPGPRTPSPWPAILAVMGLAVFVALLLLAFQPGLTPGGQGPDDAAPAQVSRFTGRLAGSGLTGPTAQEATHALDPVYDRGSIVARLAASAQGAQPGTEMVLEMRDGNGWRQLGRTFVDSGGADEVRVGPLDLGELRVRVSVRGSTAAVVDYEVTVEVHEAPRSAR